MINPVRKAYLIRLTFRIITAALEAMSLVSVPSIHQYRVELTTEEIEFVVGTAASILVSVEIRNAEFEYRDGHFQVSLIESPAHARETSRTPQTE